MDDHINRPAIPKHSVSLRVAYALGISSVHGLELFAFLRRQQAGSFNTSLATKRNCVLPVISFQLGKLSPSEEGNGSKG